MVKLELWLELWSRVLHNYFVYIPPTALSNGPSVNKVLSCLVLLKRLVKGGVQVEPFPKTNIGNTFYYRAETRTSNIYLYFDQMRCGNAEVLYIYIMFQINIHVCVQ